MSPVITGVAQPGIVEELYISGNFIKFRNYSVNNTILDYTAIATPVSVKWGVRDNHFFVQTGTGATAVFRIYTLDRAVEGAIYQPGIIPTATLNAVIPISSLGVTVCIVTFSHTVDLDETVIAPFTCVIIPTGTITESATASVAFLLRTATFTGEAFGGQAGTVQATMFTDEAVLDGDLHLLMPFRYQWIAWKAPLPIPLISVVGRACGFPLTETHAVVVDLNMNTVIASTLQASMTRNYSEIGKINTDALRQSGGNGSLGILGDTILTQEDTLYTPVSNAVESGGLEITTWKNASGSCSWIEHTNVQRKRWTIETRYYPLGGRRSPGSLSGRIMAIVQEKIKTPTNAISAWASDVKTYEYLLFRGGGLAFQTTLVAATTTNPVVSQRSFNERYLLWSIPGRVYRTTLTAGDTIEVGTDITKFTSRSLTLINPTYLYSLAETNDDEGIEGHFFVDIEATPLPTTDLPVAGSLVKWDMFNPVDDLKHL